MANSNLKEQLVSLGWSVKTDVLEGGNQQRIADVKKQLLDSDLRHCGEKSLPESTKLDQTSKSFIVQLHKTRNVTAPKDNESSSHRAHLYRLIITDGHVFQNALVLPSLKNFNLDTPPGTKILLKPKTKVSNGFYLLNDQTCEVLGGNVTELVQKWKLTKLMGKHVRTLIGEGAPPPWVPFGVRPAGATTVDTSQRVMDVVKLQQPGDEDPEFVRIRRAAIDTLLTSQISKTQRFASQDVMKGVNVAKGFEQINRRGPVERPSSVSSSVSSKPSNMEATVTAIKTNTRLPDWAKNQIADEPTEEEKRRPQLDRKPAARRNFDDDDDDRPRRGGGFGRNRRGRGRDDDGGEETRPSKDVTLFDFLESKSKSTQQKAQALPPKPANPPPQKFDSKATQLPSASSNKPPSFVQSQAASASNQSRVSSAVQKQIFEYENGDQVLARYPEDNEYYPAIIMSIMHESQTCSVMFEGYDAQEIVTFDDIESYEEGYYEDEAEQEQIPPPPPPPSSQRQNAAAAQQYQRNPMSASANRANIGGQQRNQAGYSHHPQQYDQSAYGHYNQQNHNRPNSGRGYPPQQQQQQQQQYPHQYYNNNNHY